MKSLFRQDKTIRDVCTKLAKDIYDKLSNAKILWSSGDGKIATSSWFSDFHYSHEELELYGTRLDRLDNEQTVHINIPWDKIKDLDSFIEEQKIVIDQKLAEIEKRDRQRKLAEEEAKRQKELAEYNRLKEKYNTN